MGSSLATTGPPAGVAEGGPPPNRPLASMSENHTPTTCFTALAPDRVQGWAMNRSRLKLICRKKCTLLHAVNGQAQRGGEGMGR